MEENTARGQRKEEPMKIVLYTGGLDSFIGLWLLQRQDPDKWVPLYFDTGSSYAWKEIQALVKNPQKGAYVCVVQDILKLSSLEQADSYVPQRNTLLCTATQALYDGSVTDIALCSVADDVYRDNGERFHREMTKLLTLTAGYSVGVFSPLNLLGAPRGGMLMTKRQSVARYLELGGDARALQRTVSCYDAKKEKCGTCKACTRHAAALRAIGPM